MVTRERVRLVCEALGRGESETAGCLKAGIGLTAWNIAKRVNEGLRQCIAAARDEWARLRHAQYAAALFESQAMRAANRKALKPQPTHQAKLVMWHLTTRVSLTFAAIPENEIVSACAKFNLPMESWKRQERAFGLEDLKFLPKQFDRSLVWSLPSRHACQTSGCPYHFGYPGGRFFGVCSIALAKRVSFSGEESQSS